MAFKNKKKIVIINEKNEIVKSFETLRKAAEYFGIYDSYLHKMLHGVKRFNLEKKGKIPPGHIVKYFEDFNENKEHIQKEKISLENQMIESAKKMIKKNWFEKNVSSETGIGIKKLEKIAIEMGYKVHKGQYVPFDW